VIGQTISHYEILSELGRGGMGVVYRARDIELDRVVAMKFLPPGVARVESAAERFMVEARSAAKLDHPNICNIYEVGRSEEGQPFIAMAYYEGEELADRLAREPVSHAEARDIVGQVAMGLEAAHQAGIVHRDIKPQNLFLTNDGLVKILDFGLAKVSTQETLTAVGTTVGTISYMSPEQAEGADIDQRTDTWSLGVILYEMLAGRRPFDSAYPQATIYSILNADTAPLPDDVPEDLLEIVQRCLQKNRDDRFASSADIATALGESVVALPVAVATPFRFSRVHIAVAALLAVVIAATTAYQLREQDKPVFVFLPFEDLGASEEQSIVTQEWSMGLGTQLKNSVAVAVKSRRESQYFRDNRTSNRGMHDDGIDWVVEGQVSRDGDQVSIAVQVTDAETGLEELAETYEPSASTTFQASSAILGDISGWLGLAMTAARIAFEPSGEAYSEYQLGIHYMDRQTQTDLRLALRHFENAVEAEPLWAAPYTGTARITQILWNSGLTTPEELALGLKYAERAMELDSLLAESWVARSVRETVSGNYAGSISALKRALELDPESWVAQYWLGGSLSRYVDAEQATGAMIQGLANNPKDKLNWLNLAYNYLNLGRWDDALAALEELSLIEPHFEDMDAWTDALVLVASGEREQLRDTFREWDATFVTSESRTEARESKLQLLIMARDSSAVRALIEQTPDSLWKMSDRVLASAGANDFEQAFKRIPAPILPDEGCTATPAILPDMS
jgi:TolB-like protein/tetratricopeptide (TPR) repeat protein